ncbi:hypothetical protein PS876_02777 [Pseudomonas fluorescens]|nr:hypothetical protein PS876_02777 [Pseudomonas fluorescens]
MVGPLSLRERGRVKGFCPKSRHKKGPHPAKETAPENPKYC